MRESEEGRDRSRQCGCGVGKDETQGTHERILHFVHSSWNFFAVLLFLGKNIPARSCAPEN